jgi:hypothetical protein
MQYYYTVVLVRKTYCLCFRNYAPTLFAQAEARKRNCEQALWLYGEDQQVQNITFNTTRCIEKVIQLWHVIVHYILCYPSGSIQDGGCYFLSSRNLNCFKQFFSTFQEDNSIINVNLSSYSTVRFLCGLVLKERLSRPAILNYKTVLKCRIKLKL